MRRNMLGKARAVFQRRGDRALAPWCRRSPGRGRKPRKRLARVRLENDQGRPETGCLAASGRLGRLGREGLGHRRRAGSSAAGASADGSSVGGRAHPKAKALAAWSVWPGHPAAVAAGAESVKLAEASGVVGIGRVQLDAPGQVPHLHPVGLRRWAKRPNAIWLTSRRRRRGPPAGP